MFLIIYVYISTVNSVFALLFGYLLLYILKQNQIREENYQNIIKQLSNTLPEIGVHI
ncbi:BhlA/UviB family holin-like peptide, partial [Clostridium perfringens]